ncbi:hypothetical protein J25TS5_36720 [Paenibacillus faecis]|uniref:hypothetical protein n=1 Tax=Paenibacillus faecis TaxID=862114 RepID=UPI001B09A241|nr:hypothetical protein [Paenibacillus faecis]GIO86740.1 hypothetical protein J25TS5_36720 [Paenibacillus faecis]
MKYLKLLFSLILILIVLVWGLVGLFAKGRDVSTITNYTKYGEIQLKKSDFSKVFESEGPVYLGDGLWAEALSFDELIHQIAANRNESVEKIRNIFSKSGSSGAVDEIFYVHFYQPFEVGNTGWYPQIDVYVKCKGAYKDFVEIEDLHLRRSYNSGSKSFSGKIRAKMESSQRIYWVINGDFYDNGTTQTSFSGAVGMDNDATLSFSVENQKGHFGYVYKTGYMDNR